jgi:hypothetical protein
MEWESVNTESKKKPPGTGILRVRWEVDKAAAVMIRRANNGEYEKEQNHETEIRVPGRGPVRRWNVDWL